MLRVHGMGFGALVLFLLLCNFWFICSGSVSFFLMSCGVLSAAVSVLLSYKVLYRRWGRSVGPIAWGRLPVYLAFIIKEAVLSGLAMVKNVWVPDIVPGAVFQVVPSWGCSRPMDLGAFKSAVLCCSITFTPGTAASALKGMDVEVNCYDDSMRNDLLSYKIIREADRLAC